MRCATVGRNVPQYVGHPRQKACEGTEGAGIVAESLERLLDIRGIGAAVGDARGTHHTLVVDLRCARLLSLTQPGGDGGQAASHLCRACVPAICFHGILIRLRGESNAWSSGPAFGLRRPDLFSLCFRIYAQIDAPITRDSRAELPLRSRSRSRSRSRTRTRTRTRSECCPCSLKLHVADSSAPSIAPDEN
ncbi:hypothetical protein D9M72_542900 [compost metagenome]